MYNVCHIPHLRAHVFGIWHTICEFPPVKEIFQLGSRRARNSLTKSEIFAREVERGIQASPRILPFKQSKIARK